MERAVAIEYRRDAPKIIAKAGGELVKKMLKIAAQKNITIYRDADLTEVLYRLKTGDDIPEQLFGAVAAVMAYCYRVNDSFKNKINAAGLIDG
ncbi:MAG TPA: EscU/YscU/HrcU family type III secretion system export apparatus switch protein [Spirochaetota bacterium]|nr:flagellar biosynthesis protein FlhB [Spirochaetota bacterium]HQO39479.1 EscU/YscU/HrcU family type III secretion system export apparatus switch protein [Spirochaetota bacterium]